jgi:hypothetical protein
MKKHTPGGLVSFSSKAGGGSAIDDPALRGLGAKRLPERRVGQRSTGLGRWRSALIFPHVDRKGASFEARLTGAMDVHCGSHSSRLASLSKTRE